MIKSEVYDPKAENKPPIKPKLMKWQSDGTVYIVRPSENGCGDYDCVIISSKFSENVGKSVHYGRHIIEDNFMVAFDGHVTLKNDQ